MTGVGKTSLTNRVKLTPFIRQLFGKKSANRLEKLCIDVFSTTYDPCGEDNYRKMESLDGEKVIVEYLDTASQDEYAALREQWMRHCEGAMLVYSVSLRESFDKIQGLWDTFKQVKTKQGAWDGYVISIIGNKIDLQSDERVVTGEEGRELAERLGCLYAECSVKEGVGCQELANGILKKMKTQRERTEADAKAYETKEIEDYRREEQNAEKLRNSRWRRAMAHLNC